MLPLIVIAAAFLLGACSHKSQEETPPKKAAEPEATPRPSGDVSHVPPPPAAPGNSLVKPVGGEDKIEVKKKLSPEELKEMSEKLRKIIEIQRNYGTSCPPPEKLPPGVECQELYESPRLGPLDPSSPDRFREIMRSKNPPGVLQI